MRTCLPSLPSVVPAALVALAAFPDAQQLCPGFEEELCIPHPNTDYFGPAGGTLPAHIVVVPPDTAPNCDATLATGTGGPYPLLVVFRGAGNAATSTALGTCTIMDRPQESVHWKPYDDSNSDLMQEAAQNGWLVVSLMGAPTTQVDYGSPQGLLGAEAALEHVLSTYNVDREKIYGFSHSMSATSMLAFAARNLDPQADVGMFAGLVTVGGITSTSMYWNSFTSSPAKGIVQQMLALPTCSTNDCLCLYSPEKSPFAYQKSAGVYTDCADNIDHDESLGLNLRHLPFWGLIDPDDSTADGYMQALEDLLDGSPKWNYHAAEFSPWSGCLGHCYNVYKGFESFTPNGETMFEVFDGSSVAPYDQPIVLADAMPAAASVLVADDAGFFYFDVTRDDDQSLGEFDWWQASSTRLVLNDCKNIDTIEVRTTSNGLWLYPSDLDLSVTHKVEFLNGSPDPTDVVLGDYAAEPTVTRATQAGSLWAYEFLSNGNGYTYANGELSFTGSGSRTQVYTITP